MTNLKITTRRILLSLFISFTSISVSQAAEEKVLNIYNWVDYIAPDTIANFEKETGIKVRYDTYEDNETLDEALRNKKSDYDIVMPSNDWAKAQIDSGLLQKIDKSKLPNYKNLDPAFLQKLKAVDPGNDYLVGWLWGYTTLGINVDKVVKALGKTPIPNNLWDLVFNPVYTKKLKSCGIVFLDSPTDIMPIALHYVGKSSFSNDADDYAAAASMLKKVRPDIKSFVLSGQAEMMVDQSMCVAIGWGGDFYRARNASIKKKDGQNIAPVFPKSGSLLFLDSMAIPKNAKHPENAHLFINYILDAKVHAGITNFTKYANPNAASRKFITQAMLNDQTLFLAKNDIDRLIIPKSVSEQMRATREEAFERFKASK